MGDSVNTCVYLMTGVVAEIDSSYVTFLSLRIYVHCIWHRAQGEN